jgi:uridine kinase
MAVLIGICGGSAAGKTYLATQLRGLLGKDAAILSQDHYYRDIGPLSPEERLKVNFDCPEAIDE